MPHQQVEIVHLNLPTLVALAAGDLESAQQVSPTLLSEWLASQECRGTWALRAAQVDLEPDHGGWVTGVVRDALTGDAVGKAGFHAPPDERGMVEVGYAIDPAYRGQGYARAALAHLMDRAHADPRVTVVRASIAPDNIPSQRTIAAYDFVLVGDQWDEEDGLEVVYECSAITPN